MLAFHSDEAVKAKYLGRVAAHREADELVQGATGQDGRGCAVWCTLDHYDHTRYPVELGIPMMLAHLEDAIFEGLPVADAMLWPTQFLEAVRVGADLETLGWKFLIWMLRDSELLDDGGREDVRAAIDATVKVLEAPANGKPIDESAASAARSAAWSAASAARSAARSAASAAWSAESAERSAAWKKMADKLLDMLAAYEEPDDGLEE